MSFNYYYKKFNNAVWTNCVPITGVVYHTVIISTPAYHLDIERVEKGLLGRVKRFNIIRFAPEVFERRLVYESTKETSEDHQWVFYSKGGLSGWDLKLLEEILKV